MESFDDDLTPNEEALERDKNTRNKALRRICYFGATALVGIAVFIGHEAQNGWEFNINKPDIERLISGIVTGFGVGGVIGTLGLYTEATDRLKWRQEMIEGTRDHNNE
jgi:hypothetical protein